MGPPRATSRVRGPQRGGRVGDPGVGQGPTRLEAAPPDHSTISRTLVSSGATLLLARARAPPIASTDGFCCSFSVSPARNWPQYELTNTEATHARAQMR